MGRRVIAIFAAAVVALIGVTSVLLYARSADARAVQANQPVDAYIAAKVVPAGTTLKDAVRIGLLEKTTAAAKGLPAGALTRVTDSNSSLLAMTDIQPGEFVMSARFGTTPTGNKAIQVPPGHGRRLGPAQRPCARRHVRHPWHAPRHLRLLQDQGHRHRREVEGHQRR